LTLLMDLADEYANFFLQFQLKGAAARPEYLSKSTEDSLWVPKCINVLIHEY